MALLQHSKRVISTELDLKGLNTYHTLFYYKGSKGYMFVYKPDRQANGNRLCTSLITQVNHKLCRLVECASVLSAAETGNITENHVSVPVSVSPSVCLPVCESELNKQDLQHREQESH